jgi:hypothetical protein
MTRTLTERFSQHIPSEEDARMALKQQYPLQQLPVASAEAVAAAAAPGLAENSSAAAVANSSSSSYPL